MTAGLSAQPQNAQRIPRGTSGFRGTLTDALLNEPIAGCTVRASLAPGGRNDTVVTGPSGTFEFSGIVEGNYFFMIDCPLHESACSVAADTSAAPCGGITVFKDQQRRLDLRLALGATVRGRVIDSAGRPISHASVRIGGPFVGNTLVMARQAMTKPDGTFEMTRVPAGEWLLEVDTPPAPGASRAPLVYYPGVLNREEAVYVEVSSGIVKDGVTITTPPVLDRSISVRVPPPDGTMSDMNVFVIRGEPLMSRRLDLDAEGNANIKGLTAGRYVVMATAVLGKERWADFQIIDFLDESVDIALQLRPAGRIRGRIIVENGGVPQIGDSTIGAYWVDNDVVLNPLSADEGQVAIDGSFEIAGLFGRRRLQLERFDAGWRIHAVMQGKRDVTESGIEVVPGDAAEVTVILRPR